jgi:lysine/arginine/ornithine transport system substrate-binding protein
VLLLSLTACTQVALAQQTLRFGVDPTFPPFESKAADGSLQGFDIDLGNAICAQAKVKCQWVEMGFDSSIPALQAKKFDAILSAMSMTDKRRQQVAFSDMLYNTPSALLAPSASKLTTDIASCAGKPSVWRRAPSRKLTPKPNGHRKASTWSLIPIRWRFILICWPVVLMAA